jgi:uncharacterized membrane protein
VRVSAVPPIVATLACGTFFGAALYINLVQQPAALAVGVDFAGRFFGPMYQRAAVMQVSAVLVGTIAALLAWWQGGGVRWLAGALLLFAVVPLTLLAILPVNAELLKLGAGPAAPDTAELLARWARLHAVRTALSGVAFLLFLLASPRA